MDNFKLDKDIDLCCVKAASFPDGIGEAHKKMNSIFKGDGRRRFGVSYSYDDRILYMAGEEIMKSEKIPPGFERYILREGSYFSFYIQDFPNNISQIEKSFSILTNDPRIDENGCCVECYFPEGAKFENAKDVRCMVRIAD